MPEANAAYVTNLKIIRTVRGKLKLATCLNKKLSRNTFFASQYASTNKVVPSSEVGNRRRGAIYPRGTQPSR